MSEWVRCASCGLKHSIRPDETCPRCGGRVESLDADDPGRLQSAVQHEAEAPETSGLPLGPRLAGLAMVLNGILILAERLMLPAAESGPASAPRISGVMVSLILGSLLLANTRRALWWGRASAILGLVVYGILFSVDHDTILLVFQLAYSCGLLLLLFGAANTRQLTAGAVALSGYFLLEVLGLTCPLVSAKYVLLLRGDISGSPRKVIAGAALPYEITLIDDNWYSVPSLRAKELVRTADRAVYNIRSQATVIIATEKLQSGSRADAFACADSLLHELKTGSVQVEVLDTGPLRGRLDGQYLHVRLSADGESSEACFGLYVVNGVAYQILAFASPKDFTVVELEVMRAMESFIVTPRA